MPKFSIIAVDYEKHVPRNGMVNGLKSLVNQTFKDFELIICHDGPKEVPYSEEFDFSQFKNKPVFMNTPVRMNDWGHSSRDMAMKKAKGEYFFQFNIDNILYPNCLEKINEEIEEADSKIIIFSIIHHKHFPGSFNFIFTGLPPIANNIDAMQLVAHRGIWGREGYWYNKEPASDGIIYEKMCQKYSYVSIPEALGENF
jgi:hypothetical protein